MDTRRQKLSESSWWRWLSARPLVADSILALFLADVALIVGMTADDGLNGAPLLGPDSLLDWIIIIGPAWMVPFRRVAPCRALVVGAALQATVWLAEFPDAYMALATLLYSTAAFGGLRGLRLSWIVGISLTAFTVLGVLTGGAPTYAIPIIGLSSAAATSFGMITAGRQAYTEATEARARELERSRQSDQDRALVDERARIARELHDVVAHGLSVIVVQASAAQRILDRDPDGTASALQQIEQTGRTALNEMRQVLGAIRTEPAESWQPAPGLESLDGLVAEMRSTGLVVTINEERENSVDTLPATVDLTAYRIIQESLTNVLKHGGPGAKATVEISHGQRSLDLKITDDGRGAQAGESGGHGLRGMQERVEVFGGSFAAGPHSRGGFVVSVSLPLDGAGVSL